MNKENYIEIINTKLNNENSKKIMLKQLNRYYEILNKPELKYKKFQIGDKVLLKKGTLLHGTYKNIDGLKEIIKNGLISSLFIDGRLSKYPSAIGVWNLKKDYYLKDYINFYSGGTIECRNFNGNKIKTMIIPYDEMGNIVNIIEKKDCFRWYMEQTKEARFLPSLVQNEVQIGIIFNGERAKQLLKGDILANRIKDDDVCDFINPDYYLKFLKDRKHKNDFFTDRESAILFGIPACLIEGILVGRKYEKNYKIIKEIKKLLPNCYICNLDGIVIA
jgi:hypothetical protein